MTSPRLTLRRAASASLAAAWLLGASAAAGQGAPPPASPGAAVEQPAGAPAAAPPPDPAKEEEAIRRYGEGRRLLEAGDFAGALVELEASAAALPSPNTELLIGHAQRLGGKRGRAAATYRRVIASAGEKVRAGEERFQATLEEAGRWDATLRAELSEVEVFVSGPPGTTVAVDGEDVPTSPHPRGITAKLMHEPGPVAVTARAPDGRSVSGSATGAPGATTVIDLEIAAPEATEPDDGGLDPPPVASFIAAGVGVTGLVVFGVFGAMSSSAASDLDACSPDCPASLQETADGGARDQTIANVGLVVGAVGLVAAGVLWAVWPDEAASGGRARAPLRIRTSRAGTSVALEL